MVSNQETGDPGQAWRLLLNEPGQYEHHCRTPEEFRQTQRLGLVWRRVLNATSLRPPAHVFELGCGGGKHLAQLALGGYSVHGLDISSAVVERARQFMLEVSQFQAISSSVEQGNILEYDTSARAGSFDMSFHVGVVEHFLDARDRATIWCKLVALTRPGGWVVSVVPCGMHFLRTRVRKERLLGYNVPEIDYGSELHTAEFERAGLRDIVCFPHNYLGFLAAHPSKLLSGVGRAPLHLIANVLGPLAPLPARLKERAAAALIVCGRKATP
jgi:SAM-dependent methyltransferase